MGERPGSSDRNGRGHPTTARGLVGAAFSGDWAWPWLGRETFQLVGPVVATTSGRNWLVQISRANL